METDEPTNAELFTLLTKGLLAAFTATALTQAKLLIRQLGRAPTKEEAEATLRESFHSVTGAMRGIPFLKEKFEAAAEGVIQRIMADPDSLRN